MDLIPESIKGDNTQGLDQTFLERLLTLGVEQLTIDFANERDMTKLSLWLQQFGIPTELLPEDLDTFTLRDLLPLTIRIYNLSGTETSIRLLAQALGAVQAEVVRDSFALDYNSQARHDGMFHYDQGREYSSFAVSINVSGVPEGKKTAYETALRKLFGFFEPAHLYLNRITFVAEAGRPVLAAENGKKIVLEDGIRTIEIIIKI